MYVYTFFLFTKLLITVYTDTKSHFKLLIWNYYT